MRKYVLDENMQDKKITGKNIINAKDLYLECGVIDPKGVLDEYLLMMASNHGYTIVTKDKGLVLLAVKKRKEIVWSVGERLILVRGNDHLLEPDQDIALEIEKRKHEGEMARRADVIPTGMTHGEKMHYSFLRSFIARLRAKSTVKG